MCLQRQITLGFSCAEDAPWSLTKIGVSEQLVTKFIGSEFSSAQDLFDSISSHAEASLFNTAVTYLMPKIYRNSVIDTRVVGDKYDGVKPAVSKFQGFVFETDQDRGDLSVALQLNAVSIQVDFTGDIDLIVYNHTDGVQVLSETISVVAGELQTINLDTVVKGGGRHLKVSIGYDRTNVPAYNYRMYSDCTTCKKSKCGMYLFGYGAQWNADNTGMKRTGHMAGLSIDYSLVCNYESLVCSNKSLFGEAFLYKVAAEIMAYGLTSTRWTDTDKEKMEMKLGYFDDNFKRLITQAVDGVSFQQRMLWMPQEIWNPNNHTLMAISPSEYARRLRLATDELKNDRIITLAMGSAMADMATRIFERGEDVNGGTQNYDTTKEIWISNNAIRKAVNTGKTGRAKKTSYFSSYAALKSKMDFTPKQPMTFRLTTELSSDLMNAEIHKGQPPKPRILTGTEAVISLKREGSIKKKRGLERRFGTIFKFNQSEIATFRKAVDFEINKLFSV